MPRLSRCRSGRPPDSLPSAPRGAQPDPLPTEPPGAAPPSRRGEPASADRHRGCRGRFLSACIRRAADALQLGHAAIRDAAPTGARPSSLPGRPPREASATRAWRGGALRALGAAVLAAAVLLTGLLGAVGAAAQGFTGASSGVLLGGTLTPGAFTSGGSNYMAYSEGDSNNSLDSVWLYTPSEGTAFFTANFFRQFGLSANQGLRVPAGQPLKITRLGIRDDTGLLLEYLPSIYDSDGVNAYLRCGD